MSIYDKASIALIPSGTKASTLYSVLPANGNGDFTHSRSNTTATRVNKDGLIENVGSNIPRLDYPLTNGVVGDCPHLLLEPQRTNKYPYSNQKVSGGLETFAVGTSSITVTNNYATSPDGSQNAMRMIATCGSTSSDQTGLRDTLSMSAASATLSFYAKSNTSSTQTVAIHFNGGTQTVLTLTTDWQRFTYTDTSATTNNAGVVIRVGVTDTSVDVLLFGFQMEQAIYATSYIPTSGSTATRSADVCNGSGTSAEFNSSEGVLFIECSLFTNSGENNYFSIGDTTGTRDGVELHFRSESSRIRGIIYSNDSVTVNISTYSFNKTNNNKIAFKYKDNDFAIWVNGTEAVTASSGAAPLKLSNLQFADANNSNRWYGKCKQVLVFNEALSDSELATLTS